VTSVSEDAARRQSGFPFAATVGKLVPGLALAGAVAAAGYALRLGPGLGALSPMILAIVVGIGVRNTVGTPAVASPGIAFAMRRLLRLAIILLGLQLTTVDIAAVGFGGLAIIMTTVAATFLFTKAAGRLLGVEAPLAELIAAGTSICGASAVVAANSVTRGRDEDVAYAVACVTVFGSIAMVADPLIGTALGLSPARYGLWIGSSIHEIAQVVAAGFAVGRDAGEAGAVAKLTRVMMLAPVVLTMAAVAFRRDAGRSGAVRPPLPWFVFGFIALVAFNSLVTLPPAVKANAALVSTALLTVALAAMGLETDIAKLRAKGLRPLLLGAVATLFVAGFSLLLIGVTGI
jgi:uncharacterized integral membrane protein (TIGR00698 family)